MTGCVIEAAAAEELHPIILAVIVLYKMDALKSPSFTALQSLLLLNPSAARKIELMVCDNTPFEQALPPGFDGVYSVNTANPGLALRYNEALSIASKRKIPWLLLLDQDTTPTAEYLNQIVRYTSILQEDSEVVALVPKLLQDGVIQSPHARPTYKHPKFSSITGKQQNMLYAFNSASVLRVSALERIGGFPQRFWLDFLDHATFHLLQRDGGRLFVLDASLLHDLSANSAEKRDAEGMKRYQNILDAEWTYYRLYGTPTDRLYLRIRLLRGCLGQLMKRMNPREALQMLKVACRF